MRLLIGTSRLLIYWSVWLGLGFTSGGRALVKALGSPEKNFRTIAGMLLVKSGKRAEPLLLEAAENRAHLPMVLAVLGSIGDPAIVPHLRRFTEDENPDVANAAREALEVVQFTASRT